MSFFQESHWQGGLIRAVQVKKSNVINYMHLSTSSLIFLKLHNETGIFSKSPDKRNSDSMLSSLWLGFMFESLLLRKNLLTAHCFASISTPHLRTGVEKTWNPFQLWGINLSTWTCSLLKSCHMFEYLHFNLFYAKIFIGHNCLIIVGEYVTNLKQQPAESWAKEGTNKERSSSPWLASDHCQVEGKMRKSKSINI